jgi:regulator of protease activity HflC (stomatin/prohibitin superfamily)
MKSKFIIGLIAVFTSMSMTSCYERVDAGYEGIKVNLYGDSKGVDNVALVTGAVWYNPITTAVYEYPTFVQTVDYEPFTINAKDGSSFSVDPTISLKIVDGKAAQVFVKYRKDNLDDIINTTLYNYVKNAFRIQLNAYTTDELVSKREEFEKAIEDRLSKELLAENFQLEQMTSGLQYPPSLVAAIDAKNKAVQDALKIENEVKAVEAAAKKKVAEAKGQADALKIKGDAEAEYNRKISASLSTLIIQQNMIEKWNGNLPTVTGGGSMIFDMNKFIK